MKKTLALLTGLLFSIMIYSQQYIISGKVISDDDKFELPGVTIKIKGTNIGTASDIDGNFSIKINKGETLLFSYIGYDSKEIIIKSSNELNVIMSSSSLVLDEVIAIGYGSMKKSDLTGAVSSVKAEHLKKTPASGLDQALQGKAAGVTINANSGQPGAASEVRIRGIGTVNNSSPIYVVDGIITSDINYLNPSDIESLEVMKDASSTAIYGARAANGVILVTTKSGSSKRSEIVFNTYVGVQNRWNKLDLMKRDEFASAIVNMKGVKSEVKMFNEKGFNQWLYTYRLAGSSYYPITVSDKNPNGFDYSLVDTDWQDEVFVKNALIQNYHIGINGSTDNSTYSLSGSYFSQEGTIIGSNFERFTLRANTSFKVRNWLRVGENISFVSSEGRNAMNNSASAGASVLSGALAMAPWDPTHYPSGSVNKKGEDFSGRIATPSNFKNVINPYSMVESSTPKNITERFIGNVYVEITPMKGLLLRSEASMDRSYTRNKSFTSKHVYSDYDKNEKNFLSSEMGRYSNMAYTNTITYSNEINKHSFSVMLGQSAEEYNYYTLGGSGASILNPDESHWYINQTTEERLVGDKVGRNRRFSLFGRAHYTYNNKYLATINLRMDKSSRFPENMTGYFPSTALGWKMSEEDVFNDFRNIDFIKIRAGWGKTGNDQIGDDAFNQLISNQGPTFVDYVFGENQILAPGATILTYVNQGGKWETTEQWNVGVDFGFYNGLISGNIDVFVRNTSDMLLTVKGPAYIGNRYDAQANVGSVRNKGIEIVLEHTKRINKFSYNVGGNVSFIKNKLTSLNGGEKIYSHIDNIVLCDQGLPLYTFWGYEYQGIYKTDEEASNHLWGYSDAEMSYHAGDAKYRDKNGDGKITEDDKLNLGNPFPWLTYGINLSAEWRNIDLSLFFQGVYGNKIYNQVRYRTEGKGEEATLGTQMKNVWSKDNTEGYIPNPYGTSNNFLGSSRFIEDGSYLRLQNIQLGYTLPKKIITGIGLDKCRIYVTANNLFTMTDYTGYDPEVGGGVDYGNYPQSRTVMIGANINF